MKNLYQIKKQACLLVGLVFLLSTCGGQKKKSFSSRNAEDSRFQEAKLSDIPVLLDAVRLESDDVIAQKGQVVLVFASRLHLREVVNFYEQEMDRVGWQQLSSFSGQEHFLIFEKPYTVVLISVQAQKKKGTVIRVLMSTKK